MTHQPIIHGFHQLRTRKAGNIRFVDFHIKVDPFMSVEDSHRITDELSESIEDRFRIQVSRFIPSRAMATASQLPGGMPADRKGAKDRDANNHHM